MSTMVGTPKDNVVTPAAPISGSKVSKLSIGFLLARNFTLSAFSLFVDTLRLAADEGDRSRRIRCTWDILSARGAPSRSSCGIEVAATGFLERANAYDFIVVVGGLLDRGPMIDVETLSFLRGQQPERPIVGVCTGSFVLAQAGLLEGRSACVSWFHHRQFREEFPEIPVIADRLFLADGPRITCAGGAGTADLAARLVAGKVGMSAAQKALQILQIESPRAGQAPQPRMPFGVQVSNARLARALLIMEQNLADPLSMPTIAAKVGLSVRQLQRLSEADTGLTPNDHYSQIRLRAAESLLRESNHTIFEIALECGFDQASSLTRSFRKIYGCTPSAWRRCHREKANGASRVRNLAQDRAHAFASDCST